MRNKKWKFIKQEIVKILFQNIPEKCFEEYINKEKENSQSYISCKLNKTQIIKFNISGDIENFNFELKIIRPKKKINFLLVKVRNCIKVGSFTKWKWFHKYPVQMSEAFKIYDEFSKVRFACKEISKIIEEGWTSENITK